MELKTSIWSYRFSFFEGLHEVLLIAEQKQISNNRHKSGIYLYALIHVYCQRAGLENHLGTDFNVNINTLLLCRFEIRPSPVKSPIIRKYKNPDKRCSLYPFVST